MSIVIAGTLIRNSDGLSALARQALTYIDGGSQWLDWAVSTTSVHYEAADETVFLAQVQQGLHASAMALLPVIGLWVSPVKLMSLGSDNLRALGQAETGDTSVAVQQQTQRILADHALLGAKDLHSSGEFLQELGVAAAPVFQACGFDDLLALHALTGAGVGLDGDNPARLRQEAASFAVEQARTVPEFCDYYQVYLAHAKKMSALDSTAAARVEMVGDAVQTLLPLSFGAMDCPQLPDRLPSPDEVRQSLRNWLASGRRLGFSRLSQVVLQMVTQTVFRTETGADARRLLDLYLASAQSFLVGAAAMESRLGQDGRSLVFTLRNAEHQAVLRVGADRVLSLTRFGVAETSASTARSKDSSPTP